MLLTQTNQLNYLEKYLKLDILQQSLQCNESDGIPMLLKIKSEFLLESISNWSNFYINTPWKHCEFMGYLD